LVKEINGATFTSNVVLLTTGKQKTRIVGILNNPVNDKLIPVIHSVAGQKAIATIMDISCRKIYSAETQLIPGQNQWMINIPSFISAGIYFIKIETSDGAKRTLKFARQ
jgi:hypothetical protein